MNLHLPHPDRDLIELLVLLAGVLVLGGLVLLIAVIASVPTSYIP